jgi:hypothetical protein
MLHQRCFQDSMLPAEERRTRGGGAVRWRWCAPACRMAPKNKMSPRPPSLRGGIWNALYPTTFCLDPSALDTNARTFSLSYCPRMRVQATCSAQSSWRHRVWWQGQLASACDHQCRGRARDSKRASTATTSTTTLRWGPRVMQQPHMATARGLGVAQGEDGRARGSEGTFGLLIFPVSPAQDGAAGDNAKGNSRQGARGGRGADNGASSRRTATMPTAS